VEFWDKASMVASLPHICPAVLEDEMGSTSDAAVTLAFHPPCSNLTNLLSTTLQADISTHDCLFN
jgi:hypothetical protein